MSPKPAAGIAVSALIALLLASAWPAWVSSHRRASMGGRTTQRRPFIAASTSPIHGVDELTASITHEINQPLSAILANVDAGALLWKQQPLPAEELKSILTDIRDDVLRIRQIIQKLRTLLGKRSLEATVLQLNDVIAASKGLLGQLAQRHQTRLQFDLAPGLLPVMGDGMHLQQVLVNLATNGMEAMSHLPPGQRTLKLTTEKGDKGTAVFTVADTGPGVGASKLPEIFKVFYSTKPEGMGMGLSIVKTIVDAHGGKIEVGTNGRAGALFRVSLPTIGVVRKRAGRKPATAIPSA
ncbi:HAMP domain-containing sensor histidine kinase [Variovorax sp. J2P1-59]|uniref:sensor histidine kinase n=1 Tax=Variovorax flavidus TaxID=3053501 RepID=UPI00257617E0|nr:HAMP domain-containing sensor histidine kinase [Variovorax sp. J2P1-59]MDM0075935.1 HAMP domain-containing sensor histidine kinase [Variovorax sp. J2P1-59]